MNFSTEVTISDLISILTFIPVIVGGTFGIIQWRESIKIKRAEYIEQLTAKLRSDPDIREIIYKIDYNEKWYTEEFHNGGELERKVDKTLSYFSYICYLHKIHLISNKGFNFFKYEVDRCLMNKQVQDYLFNLYHFSSKFNSPFSFAHLFKYGEDNIFFDTSFYDKLSKNYPHYLNF